MLKTASQGQRAEGKKAKFDVEIASVATAVPEHKICQAEITKLARRKFSRISRGSKASMATPGLITAMPANRRTGIISTMDGKRVPPSSSAMRLTCSRKWRSKPTEARVYRAR